MVIEDSLLQKYSPMVAIVYTVIYNICKTGIEIGDKRFAYIELRRIKEVTPHLSMWYIKESIKKLLNDEMIFKGPSTSRRPVFYGVKVNEDERKSEAK